MLEVYRAFSEEVLAVPVIAGEKPENERFPGAANSFTRSGICAVKAYDDVIFVKCALIVAAACGCVGFAQEVWNIFAGKAFHHRRRRRKRRPCALRRNRLVGGL